MGHLAGEGAGWYLFEFSSHAQCLKLGVRLLFWGESGIFSWSVLSQCFNCAVLEAARDPRAPFPSK